MENKRSRRFVLQKLPNSDFSVSENSAKNRRIGEAKLDVELKRLQRSWVKATT